LGVDLLLPVDHIPAAFFIPLHQLVDRLDDGSLLHKGVFPFEASKCDTYLKLFSAASKSVFRAHVTSKLKSEVVLLGTILFALLKMA